MSKPPSVCQQYYFWFLIFSQLFADAVHDVDADSRIVIGIDGKLLACPFCLLQYLVKMPCGLQPMCLQYHIRFFWSFQFPQFGHGTERTRTDRVNMFSRQGALKWVGGTYKYFNCGLFSFASWIHTIWSIWELISNLQNFSLFQVLLLTRPASKYKWSRRQERHQFSISKNSEGWMKKKDSDLTKYVPHTSDQKNNKKRYSYSLNCALDCD